MSFATTSILWSFFRAAWGGAWAGACAGLIELALLPPEIRGIDARAVLVAAGTYALLGAALGPFLCAAGRWLGGRAEHALTASNCGSFVSALAYLRLGALWLAPVVGLLTAGFILLLQSRHTRWPWRIPSRALFWVFPTALSLLWNGIRHDWKGPHAKGGDTSGNGPSALLITIDTLRADHLGCYGYSRARTPSIDRLAEEGVLFENAITAANTTAPSHATMLTGLLPIEHGTRRNGVKLERSVQALPELLAERGYATAAFISGFPLADEACGFARCFQHYEDRLAALSPRASRWFGGAALELRLPRAIAARFLARGELWRGDRPAGETVERALEWLRNREGKREPFFLWLHLYDPHGPYQPPSEFAPSPKKSEVDGEWYDLDPEERSALIQDESAREHMIALYDGEISYADSEVGRLLAELERMGLGERTLIALTSDHGEGLGEHGYYFDHGSNLFDAEVRVPLILRLPGRSNAGSRIAEQVALLDLAPTLFSELGLVEPPSSWRSANLARGPSAAREPAPALSSTFEAPGAARAVCLSLRWEGLKLISVSPHWRDTTLVDGYERLYDLRGDAAEQRDLLAGEESLAPDQEALLNRLREQMEVWKKIAGEDFHAETSEEVRKQLQELGYL